MLHSGSELSSPAYSVEPLNLWRLGMVAFMETQTAGAERLATCLTFFGMQITHVQATIATLSNASSAALFALVVAGSRHDYVAGHKLSQGKKPHRHHKWAALPVRVAASAPEESLAFPSNLQ
jgi:hypothetical protein